jgi:6-phosphogluconolactonase
MSVTIYPSKAELADAVAEAATRDLQAAVQNFGSAVWVLTGGTSPEGAYRAIANKHLSHVDWSKVTFIMGDERQVPLNHADSNWRQADECLLHLIDSPGKAVPPTSEPLDAAAKIYAGVLDSLPTDAAGHPRLDHVWLGMGEDGHTLSLFPGRESLMEDQRLVLPIYDSPKPPPERITLTIKALRGAVNCVIMATGEGKAIMLKRAFEGDPTVPIALAASTVTAAGGTVTWMLDEAAAHLIR